jgi:hypothetical protein
LMMTTVQIAASSAMIIPSTRDFVLNGRPVRMRSFHHFTKEVYLRPIGM